MNPTPLFQRVKYELLALAVLVIVYSVVLSYLAPEQFWSWMSTLLATILSVTAAFLIGVALYSYQTNQADNKKRAELRSLVRSELIETLDSFNQNPPEDGHAEQTDESPRPRPLYVQPLVLEEAAKSGLFSYEITFAMLRLAKTMHSYNVQVEQSHAQNLAPSPFLFVSHGVVEEAADALTEGCKSLLEKIGVPPRDLRAD